MKRLLFFLVLSLFACQVMAQKVVKGTVTSKNGPIPGASILIKGTTTGTTTDGSGAYQLAIPENGGTLIASFVGFKAQEIAIGAQTTINFVLQEDDLMNEVVVIGYGSQVKQDVIGNIAKVSGEDIKDVPVPTFESSLQGRASGVVINNNSGKLGQGINIRVRGASSIKAGNQPLVVIDGIPVTAQNLGEVNNERTNPLADFNFNDVESIEVLKDASAAAIYGARASNGVILITTKKGKAGKTVFNLNLSRGTSREARRRQFLNAKEYIEFFSEAVVNSGRDISTAESTFEGFNPDWQSLRNSDGYNWQDQIFQQATMTNFDISAKGGTNKTRFYASIAMVDQEGILVNNDFQRIATRLNLDHTVSDKLKLGFNFNLARTKLNRVANDNSFYTPFQMVAQSPLSPFRDATTGDPNRSTLYDNALIELENSTNLTTRYRTLSNAYATYEIIPGLNLKTSFGLDLTNQNEDRYYNNQSLTGGSVNAFGQYRTVSVANYTWDTQLSYNKSFGKHVLGATVAYSIQQSSSDVSSVSGQDFPSAQFKKITSAGNISAGTSTGTKFSFLSYIGRVSYKYNNRYLFGLTGRYDGSSRFGVNNRYGFFPSVSAGWIISEEDFLKENSVVSFLKIRASYGLTGNGDIGNFDSRGLYQGISYAGTTGTAPNSLSFDNLKWETTTQVNLGLDLALFNDRISIEMDYYKKNTKDLLLDVNIPVTSGFTTITQNIGALENKGIEFTLNTRNLTGDFQWSTSFNVARNWNEITSIPDERISVGRRGPNFVIPGQPIGVFYTKKYAGVDPQNGDALYYLNEGSSETTNDYNAAAEMVVGNPNPNWTGGITNNFSYKGFDLNIFFQFVEGIDLYFASGHFASNSGNYWDNQTVDQLRRWQNPGDVTDVPQARYLGSNGSRQSSRFISDGSYIRLKTLSFGYTLPTSLTQRYRLSKVRFYFSAQNLLTFTNYDGDPEVSTGDGNANTSLGVDYYTTPQAKTFAFGVNLGF